MKNTTAKFVLSLGVLACLLASPYSTAFWSRLYIEVHQTITKDALKYSYKGLTFSAKAIEAINAQHLLLDGDDKVIAYAASDHFDSDKLSESYQSLVKKRSILISALSIGQQRAALENLGKILHATQDFYSHSTWVWVSKSGIIDFGKYLEGGTIPPLIAEPSAGGCLIEDDTIVFDMTGRITTGFYPPLYPPAPPEKCAHGSVSEWVRWELSLIPSLARRPGIALDFPVPKIADPLMHNNAEKAAELAKLESRAIVASIVRSVDKQLGMCGVCLLTDRFDQQVCKDAKIAGCPVIGKRTTVTNTVFAKGKKWAQPDLFTNLSWNQVNAVCPGGVCNGVLNGYNVTGWRWASNSEVAQLLNSYGVTPPLPLVFSGSAPTLYNNSNSWSDAFYADGWRVTAKGDVAGGYWTTVGMTSTTSAAGSAGAQWFPYMQGARVYSRDAVGAQAVIGWKDRQDATTGAWIYR